MTPGRAVARGGFVAAACVACCAPPLVAALGVVGGVAVAAFAFAGLAAAITAVLVAGGWVLARRRGTSHAARSASVPVGAPTRRAGP